MYNHTVIYNPVPDENMSVLLDEIVGIEPLGDCGCGCGDCNGLGAVTGQDAADIAMAHFKGLPTATIAGIGYDLVNGNFNSISAEVAKAAEKICQAGVIDKVKTTFDTYQPYIIGVAAGLVGVYVLNMATAKKRRKR